MATNYVEDIGQFLTMSSTNLPTIPTNITNSNSMLEDLPMDSNFVWLLCSLIFAISWIMYITYYNSRVTGYIITKVINRLFISDGFFKIGSLTLNVLSGKIMFRDFVYITHDYTVRVQDGYVIFRWWRSYVPKDVSEDLSHSDTRLSVVLNGFELHVYNRSMLYAHLERTFGLDSSMFPDGGPAGDSEDPDEAMNQENNTLNESGGGVAASETTNAAATSSRSRHQRPEAAMARTWRDLIPVIKMDVSSGRVVFGNRLLPTSLSITVEESHWVYSTKPAASTLDKLMHFCKCWAENARVMLVPSPKYTGMLDEPPRYMGEGFVLMATNYLELYMYMDEPGLVPEQPVLVRLANGDVVESSPPMWGIDVKCGKGTDFSYGPWADRQREHLFKFFYPNDFQSMKLTKTPKPGDKRQMHTFDIRLSMLNEATIDILFSKNKETNAIHINVGPGSYLEITIPWITLQDGCTTKINGQLLHLEATTSLQYRDFVSSETLEFSVSCHYPLLWNHHQEWSLSLTGCKATVNLVYGHKNFFTDLVNDWSSKSRPDLMHFVPYTWRFGLTLKHCELLTCSNMFNWIDCSSVGQKQRLETGRLALCAHLFHLSFDLPFDQFLPDTVPLTFSIQGESIDLSLFIPEVHTSRNVILALEKYAKILSKEGSLRQKTENIPKWRSNCQKSAGWVDFWWIPIGAINIQWVYHPAPPLGPQPQADISTPVKEELLLSPMRFPHCKKHSHHRSPDGTRKFDPTSLAADKVTVELEIGPSVLLLYGTALRNFVHLKENIFGDDQTFTDMSQTYSSTGGGHMTAGGEGDDLSNLPLELQEDFDERYFRPLEVDVSVIMHDIQAHLLKFCSETDPPCPVILIERFGFEMKKRYEQTELQLLLSPCVLLVSDTVTRSGADSSLTSGRLALSSLQLRGHAMFSDHERSLDEDTIEYAWLLELQLGKLSGKVTTPQLHQLVTSLELLATMIADSENELSSPHAGATGGPLTHSESAAHVPPTQQSTINSNLNTAASSVAATMSAVRQSLSNPQQNSTFQALLQTRQLVKQASISHAHLLGHRSSNSAVPNHAEKSEVGVVSSKSVSEGSKLQPKALPISTVINMPSNAEPDVSNAVKGGVGPHTSANIAAGSANKSTITPTDQEMNQDAHKLKYKFCRVAIDVIDFWIVECGAALQLWVSPVRIANCNLHGKQVGSGLSCVIYNTMLRQLVYQNGGQSKKSGGEVPGETSWLEVGSITMGNLVIEAIMSLSTPEYYVPLLQNRFLKMHDDKTKRLWFLWPAVAKGNGRCGCIGGCTFFGNNRNGAKFFKPSQSDLLDGINIAVFKINESGKDLGYGQSLLHEGQLVFRTPPYTARQIILQETGYRTAPPSVPTTHQLKRQATVSEYGPQGTFDLPPGSASPVSSVGAERRTSRRFSYTLTRNGGHRDVPYARLVDAPVLPAKLDSDSKLHTAEKNGKRILNVPDNSDQGPKNSASDSKLAVDYFQTQGHGEILAGLSKSETYSPQPIHMASESHHSLSTRLGSEERLRQEVQRTISMSSENQSEIFFSADEEMNPSRTSSLRHSILGSGTILSQGVDPAAVIAAATGGQSPNGVVEPHRKKFASDLSIVADRMGGTAPASLETRTGGSGPTSLTECIKTRRLSSHKSDNEIHTPEHRSFGGHLLDEGVAASPHRKISSCTHRSLSPRLPEVVDDKSEEIQDLTELQSITCDSSDSRSLSSNSYASAVCSQEDITLVDLHMQLNRHICDSPMLMSTYVGHLSQVKCPNWSPAAQLRAPGGDLAPLFHQDDAGNKLIYIGGRFVPLMETITEGFTLLKMVPKPEQYPPGTSPSTNAKTPPASGYTSVWEPSSSAMGRENTSEETDPNLLKEDELLAWRGEMPQGSRTAVIVRLQGELDVTATPLLLECLQRYIDALTPTLSTLHPLTVVTNLHSSCVANVEAANTLKRDHNVAARIRGDGGSEKMGEKGATAGPIAGGGTYEEFLRTELQMAVVLPKINITLLQASIVEEIISFSALDNIRDLTCVSLFTVCFDNITARFHRGRQAREVVQIFYRPAVLQPGGKKGSGKGPKSFLMSHTSAVHSDIVSGEPVYIETSEKQQEDLVVSLVIGKVHGQLRRLRNDSSIINDAVITAIPLQHSKVLFTCTKISQPIRGLEFYRIPSANAHANQSELFNSENKLGFIMFEFGFEGIAVKIVKKSQFEKIENEPTEEDKLIHHPELSRSRDDLESIDKQSDVSTQTTLTGQKYNTTDKTSGNEMPHANTTALAAKDNSGGNTSSCVIELKTVWFNFAAPPRAPITRKLDYTRLDWNLLSTASPAINAWLNPSNRFAIRIVHMVRSMYRRSTAVVACLMAEALDVQTIHVPAKSKYGKLTPLAKTLQEDPSCQLCSVLERYVVDVTDISCVEVSLRDSEMPQLSTLRQGVIVLSRQWKNVLYTPLLLDHNYKTKFARPLNVTFAVPEMDEVNKLQVGEQRSYWPPSSNKPGVPVNSPRTTDPSVGAPSAAAHAGIISEGIESVVTSPSPPSVPSNKRPRRGLQPTQIPSSSRASVVFPILGAANPFSARRHPDDGIGYGALHEDALQKVVQAGSDPSVYSQSSPELLPSSPQYQHNTGTSAGATGTGGRSGAGSLPAGTPATGLGGPLTASSEDLYSWMAKQQEYVRAKDAQNHVNNRREVDLLQREIYIGQESKVNTLATDSSGECAPEVEGGLPGAGYTAGVSLYPMQDSLRLLDAHLIFQPLLSSLGVMPQQMVGAASHPSSVAPPGSAPGAGTVAPTYGLDNLGSNLSLVGSMEQMRIDIVVSEHGRRTKTSSATKTNKGNQNQVPLHLDISSADETPAFLCERVSLEVEVDKMADMTVDDMIRTRNVLYISRGQLKKHTSTALNFSIGVRYIAQQVNMPLLRLLHQISNMYQNVKDTQNELREQRPLLRQPRLSTQADTPERLAEAMADISVTIAKNHSSSVSDLQDLTIVDSNIGGNNKPLSLKISDPSSIVSQAQKPVLSPSASVRSRPQSFAQKLRSTGKSVRGYMNLSEGIGTPLFTGSPSVSGGLTVGSDKSAGAAGNCWKTVYHLLDLYATMPETKTITHRFSMAADISEHYKGTTRKYDLLAEAKSAEDVDHGVHVGYTSSTPLPRNSDPLGGMVGERTRLVVFGVARIHRTRLLATLSGLKLEAEITSLHSSLTWRKKSKPASLEFSLTGQVGRTMIVLLEGVAPNQQTVVKVTVGKSQALYSSVSKRTKDKNSGLLTVGAVNIDIPQHPVALHGMVTRGSKQLSSTLQELRVTRTASRMSRSAQPEHLSTNAPAGEGDQPQFSPHHTGGNPTAPTFTAPPPEAQQTQYHQQEQPFHQKHLSSVEKAASSNLLQPLVMQFSVILQSLSITAALLPSLQAQYKMDQVNSTGVTGHRAKFTIDLPHHSLSFTTKLAATEANLPSEASIALPAVHVAAEYVPEGVTGEAASQDTNVEGLVLKQGGYLSAFAEIGVFEHSLTTDLLNHLVFVQKVFMKEINEVLQKVYGGERPVRLWSEENIDENAGQSASALNRILFSLVIRIQRIQLTATTAGSSAVRLETGAVALELSNRVQNVSGSREAVRLFGKAQVDINLCLGQLARNPMFEEAEPDFQQFAFFNTRIGLRNAFQDEMVDGENKEVVLITLKRPLVYVQPLAVDKAILVWLNYKNAYEYWNEKRANLNKEVLTATQQVLEKVPFGQITSQLAAAATGPSLGTLFLQLTVDDMGICLPLNPLPLASWNVGGGSSARGLYDESRGAVVVTLESTSIAACSSGSLVSKGRFANLCLRFAEDFDPSLDDWKPDMGDSNIMNLCVVSEGTYEVCSRTIAAKQPDENAKWFLNVQWQMEGVDINLDVNVGKQLSALGHTLTMLTGAEDGPARSIDEDSEEVDRIDAGSRASQDSLVVRSSSLGFDFGSGDAAALAAGMGQAGTLSGAGMVGSSSNSVRRLAETLPAFVLDPSLDAKKRSKLIEKEMNEQAKIINDLRSLGASHGTIEQEMRRLHELEALVFKDFRRDMIQKLRRQSVKASSIKGKLGLGSRASAYRSKSFIIPSPTPERQVEIESPEDAQGNTSCTSASYESSPRSGPSRTASLRVRGASSGGTGAPGGAGPRVTFSDHHHRQCSLPSADSELSLSQWSSPEQGTHLDIDGERVELRRKGPPTSYESVDQPLLDGGLFEGPKNNLPPGGSNNTTANINQQQYLPQKPQEPNIDFELDVKVLINSGKCVLHTKDPVREDELKLSRMRKDRSCSAGLLEFPLSTGSPDPTRRNKESNPKSSAAKDQSSGNTTLGGANSSQSRYRTGAGPHQLIDLTIFHIPGMDIKLHYESKIVQDDSVTSVSSNSVSGVQHRGRKPPKSTQKDQPPEEGFMFGEQYDDDVDYDTEIVYNAPATRRLERTDELCSENGSEVIGDRSSSQDNINTSSPCSSKSSKSLNNFGISNPNYLSSPTTSIPSELDMHMQMDERRDVFSDSWRPMKSGGAAPCAPRKPGIKKASLFAWMTLQSIPEETIISPHILEFLEQTLEPIPSKTTNINSAGQSTTVFSGSETLNTDITGGGSSGYGTYVYTSFPVDVIVYFHMQPSTFRFSCLPVSRVECMLQLPSLDIVFSSKRAEEETFGEFGGQAAFTPATAVGGLSVTGCLADFSVYIFHPYGGGKKSGLKEAQWSPLADSERKDSLSINVEFVKFHLSRSRKLNFQQESDVMGKLSDQSRAVIRFSTIIDIGSASFKYDMRRLTEILAFPKAWYRRSIVRRLFLGDLSGIGAMYSDDGDDTIPEEEVVPSPASGTGRSPYERHDATVSKNSPIRNTVDRSPMRSARDKLRLSFEASKRKSRASRLRDLNRETFSSSESALSDSRALIIEGDDLENTPSPSEAKGGAAWETLVLFAVNFTKLNVHMNMGNVMGNVTWQTKDFRSEGRLSIGSTGHKNIYNSLGLAGSTLDAKGGIVGGTIEIANIDTYIHIREEPNMEPDHTIGLKLHALELRLDYMGTSVLMCRVSALDVTLKDEWRLNRDQPGYSDHEATSGGFMPPTRRPATIFVHGVLGWDQLQLMISKSSTADLIKMYHKLEEFFSQQFNSSKRVFSRLGPTRPQPHSSTSGATPAAASLLRQHTLRVTNAAAAVSTLAMDEARHHRHWQKALRHVGGLQLNTVHWPLPSTGTVLGGTVELRGQNISLACFHGINFKSKSWALFSLKEPCISFNTEAQEIPSSGQGHDVHVVETLTCSLGLSTYKTHHSMATVCKVSRNVLFPPQFKTLQEWFHYAFASSHIDEVDRFPSLERERPETATNSIERARSTQSKLQDPNHTREIIFALPSLQLHLKTEHLQTAGTPTAESEKPIVECSFITEFEDHIFVTVDAEAFFFLHDLITSYVKEKEKVFVSSLSARASSPDPDKFRPSATPSSASAHSSEDAASKKKGTPARAGPSTPAAPFDPDDLFTKDWRSYQCKTWHMEPTVRLLSWAGKSIEPYGIDYILQKLGFSHARTTIPKWTQRGFMDPLDKILAVLTLRMVAIIKEEKNEQGKSPIKRL